MDGVAGKAGPFHVQFHIEKGQPGTLHGREQQPLGEAVNQGPGREGALDDRLFPQEFAVGEHHFVQPYQIDEAGDVGFQHGAAPGLEAVAHGQILPVKSGAQLFHVIDLGK